MVNSCMAKRSFNPVVAKLFILQDDSGLVNLNVVFSKRLEELLAMDHISNPPQLFIRYHT